MKKAIGILLLLISAALPPLTMWWYHIYWRTIETPSNSYSAGLTGWCMVVMVVASICGAIMIDTHNDHRPPER